MISGTLSFDMEFDLEGQMPVERHGCLTCPGVLAVICNYFGSHADVIEGQYPVPRPLTLNLTLKVKCLKGHGRVCCPGGLAII